MIEWGVSAVKDLDTYFATLGTQEAAIIGSLIVSLASLCLLFVLLRRRSKGTTVKPAVSDVEPPEGGPQAVSEVTAAQGELREMIREFSTLAEQVLRVLDREQVAARLPAAGGTALQLLDLGLTPTEAARATGMSVGEVALLMNLHRMKAAKDGLTVMPTCDAGDLPNHVREGNGGSGHGKVEVAHT